MEQVIAEKTARALKVDKTYGEREGTIGFGRDGRKKITG